MPPKQTPATRAKIAASMRHGRANKVPFSGKLDPDLMKIFKRTAKARGMNLNTAHDAAIRTWIVAKEDAMTHQGCKRTRKKAV